MSIRNRQNDAAPPRRRRNKWLLTPAQELARDLWSLWTPRSPRLADAWAEQERMMSAEECDEGNVRWDFLRVPHTREIMRAYSDAPDQVLWFANPADPAEPIAVPWTRYNKMLVWMSSAQQAKTQTLCCLIGWHMREDPRQLLVMFPSQHLLRVFSMKKMGPMLRDTPCLQGLIADNKSRDRENTIESKSFPGGGISILIGSSGNNLRSWSGPVGICDEFDALPSSASKQGDPFMMLLDRVQTFSRQKIVITGTPLETETSRIEPMYDAGTREQWQYRCPSCRGFQVVAFDDRLDHDALTYVCCHCGCVHAEEEWKAAEARWIARGPKPLDDGTVPAAEYRSFHTSAMTSLLTDWEAIVEKYRLAMKQLRAGNIEPYRVFVNSVRGETFQEHGEELPADLFTRPDNPQRHAYAADVPRGVKLLTAAIDTQGDSIRYEVRGYGNGLEQWGITYGRFDGHPDYPELIHFVESLLDRTWLREDGAHLNIARLVWDAMGNYADHVYKFTREHEARGVYAVRGGSEWAAPVIQRLGFVKQTGNDGPETPIWTIGTIAAKNTLYDRLNVREPGPGFCHWPTDAYLRDGFSPRGYTEAYFAELQSEKRVKRTTKGYQHNAWVPKRAGIRNEGWDLLVYNLAALLIYLDGRVIDDLPDLDKPAPAAASPSSGYTVIRGGVSV